MSNVTKIFLVIIVLAAIAGGVWWYVNSSANTWENLRVMDQSGTQTEQNSGNGVQTAQSGQQAQTAQDSVSGSVGATTNTDDSMAQDTSAIDSQLSGLNDDNASADHGLSSQ